MSEVKFIPPQLNSWLTRFLQTIWHLVTFWLYRIRLEVSEANIVQVKAIAGERVVYMPNHSNLDDAIVIFGLSAQLRQLFHYVVAYEAFRGWLSKLLPQVGAYSIRRGLGDRRSIGQTLKILQQPRCKLVIFPEGGCSYQNDTVIPFRSGAVELAFKAMAKLAVAESEIPNLWLVPVSLKYSYQKDGMDLVMQALERLESSLELQPKAGHDCYQRLRRIAGLVLEKLEIEYGLTSKSATSWNERIDRLRQQMLAYCESSLDITVSSQTPSRERVYKIQSKLELGSSENYKHLKLTSIRLLNFDAIYDGYIIENPTPERYLATIDRMEREIFQIDRPKYKGPRTVQIKLGEPINLKHYWSLYLGHGANFVADTNTESDSSLPSSKVSLSRQELVRQITMTIQKVVQANLS